MADNKPYHFPAVHKRKAQNLPTGTRHPIPPVTEQMGLIHGIKPGSKNEWHVAQALDTLGREYQYQVPLAGGHLSGGIILDFLVYSPFPIAVQVQGSYWHRNKERDRMALSILQKRYGHVEDFNEDETSSVGRAIQTIRERLS